MKRTVVSKKAMGVWNTLNNALWCKLLDARYDSHPMAAPSPKVKKEFPIPSMAYSSI